MYINLFKIDNSSIFMFDVVIPNNNEEEFIDMALLLGYSEIVFLTNNIRYEYKSGRIKICKAYLLKDTSEIKKARKSFDYMFASSGRNFFESKVDFIIDAEKNDSRDSFHYRKTSLNQVHAKLCKENDIFVVFGFGSLLKVTSIPQLNVVLGRMMQNAVLIKKYKIKHESFSMASSPLMMRSRNLLDAFSRVIGL